jgi:hypothetical protein
MPRRVPDTTKVRNLIGFRTTRDLEEILQSVIAYQREKAPPAVRQPLAPAAIG